MKKAVSVLLIVALMLTLVGCGSSSTEEKDKTSGKSDQSFDSSTVEGWAEMIKSQHEGETLNLLFAAHDNSEVIKDFSDEFEKMTGITVNWKIIDTTQLKNDQMMDFSGKAGGYDLYMVDRFWLDEYVAKDMLVPIDSYLEDSQLTPEWFDFEDILQAYRDGLAKIGDSYYGVPIVGETRLVGYRTDLFEKYGKEPPKTMDEMLELAEFFNEKEEGLYGIAMRAQKGILCASGWMSLVYNFSDGFIDQETGESLMDDPKNEEALQYFVDLLKNAPPDVSTYTHEEALGAFITGKTAMWLDANALIPSIMDPDKSQIYDKVDFVPTPEGPYGRGAALSGWSMGIPTTSEHQDAAWAFMMYMSSKEMSKTLYEAGAAPTRTSIFTDEQIVESDPTMPAQILALEEANELVKRGIAWIPPNEKTTQMFDIVGNYANQAITGEISVHDACKYSHEELSELME